MKDAFILQIIFGGIINNMGTLYSTKNNFIHLSD